MSRRIPLFRGGGDPGGKRSNHLVTGVTPRAKKQKVAEESHIVGSPGVVSQLSLEDSFFDDVDVGNLENTREVQEKVQSEEEARENTNPQLNISKESKEDMFEESDTEDPGDTTLESQPVLSLPLSFVDVRARALEELKMKAAAGPEVKSSPVREEKPSQISRLVKDEVDRGPFFGLPSRVAELYEEVKGVKELFAWQTRCLNSPAVKNKSNLLYSLPTSGGKTLVAEIIMLQEILCYKRNVLFILPFVSIVQEKIKALTPFALELGFYLEEYAGPKGRFPPSKRRHKNTLYVCTIEKAHALFNSLVAEGREKELGLLVIDEVHMLGEGDRGANLESLLVKSLHVSREKNFEIQLVAMSATVGNLKELAAFLQAELFTDNFRPVDLKEFVKVDSDIVKIDKTGVEEDQFKFLKKVPKETDGAIVKIDPDGVTDLVLEVFPAHSVLLFCDTKRRCENVAEMLVKVIILKPERNTEILQHRAEERRSLLAALRSEGGGFVCPVLSQTVGHGVAYHHSGLTMDERKLLEEAFLAGSLGVLCCTSTLAAGVNLPARRVIIRSPYLGRSQLSNTQYRQMVGRAGRAGLDTQGESFLLVKNNLARLVPDIVTAPVENCRSRLSEAAQGRLLSSLVLNCLQLGLIKTLSEATRMLSLSLLSVQLESENLSALLESAVLFLLNAGLVRSSLESEATQQSLTPSTVLESTKLGRACVSGNIELSWAASLYSDLSAARTGLAVDTSLHLLYLVTPYDLAPNDRAVFSSPNNYHGIYESLKESERAVARNLGITEGVMVGLVMGRQVKKQTALLNRFYYALILLELWQGSSVHAVAERFQLSRGEVQGLMSSAASFSASVFHFCQEVEEFWAYQELLEPFSKRLAHCCSPELLPLLDLPGVKIGRAKQLHSAGLVSVGDISRSKARELVEKVEHLSYKAATSIIQAAKLIVREKVEALRDEAEIAMLDLNKMIKSRTEIALARLLSRCQEMAASTEDISAEWRLPKFIASCEEMLGSLPRPPDSGAPPPDTITEFQNKIKFLRSLLPPPSEPEEELTDQRVPAPASVPMPMPQGSGLARDTVSKQIYQKMAERQNLSARDQLLSSASSQVDGVKGLSLDKILSDQREQQEKIAEEMLLLTKDLKEQSTLAGNIIRKDTGRLEQSSAQADSNLEKLNIETKRVAEFSERGNCRCWIWLMMVIVIFTFIGMVLMMRLFSKKTVLPSVESPDTITQSQSRYVEEL